jgi:hypothetical protein
MLGLTTAGAAALECIAVRRALLYISATPCGTMAHRAMHGIGLGRLRCALLQLWTMGRVRRT